ncbi:MAG: restriction endonuclease subunit S [Rhodanobacter sp.]
MEVREASAAYDGLVAVDAGAVPVGYKRTEVGVIPEDWSVSTVGSEFTVQLGKMLDNDKNEGVPKPFLGNRSVQWGRIDLEDIGEIKLSRNDLKRYRLRDGDLLVCEGGEVGRAAIWNQPMGECYYQKALHRLRPIRGYSTQLMLNQLQQMASSGELENYVTQTSIAHLPKDKFETVPIPVPSSDIEQEAIAEALSDADALIESLEQMLAKKRQIKQGTMQELLTGKRRLPGFKGVWQTKALGDLFTVSGGFSASRAQLSSDGYCYLHYGDIHTSTKTFIDVREEFQNLPKLDVSLKRIAPSVMLDDGDVVFVDASEDDEGTSKHVVVTNPDRAPFISGLHTIVAKAKSTDLDHLYLRYCFQTQAVKSQFRFFAVGTKVSGISKSNIVKVTIPLPALKEQFAIAGILSDMDTEIAALETRLAKAFALKQGMMQQLLTGRIRLVQPTSNVVSLPVAARVSTKGKQGHNRTINEAVVIAKLTQLFSSDEWPLARVRRTKLAYLLHRHVEKRADGFLKKAAGPYDPTIRYRGPERVALKNGYVRAHHNGAYEGLVAADKIAQAETYFEKWYGTDAATWVEQFRWKKTDELELLATVDMAMEDLRREGKQADLDAVKQLIRDHAEWKPKLEKAFFSDDHIVQALDECRALFGDEET